MKTALSNFNNYFYARGKTHARSRRCLRFTGADCGLRAAPPHIEGKGLNQVNIAWGEGMSAIGGNTARGMFIIIVARRRQKVKPLFPLSARRRRHLLNNIKGTLSYIRLPSRRGRVREISLFIRPDKRFSCQFYHRKVKIYIIRTNFFSFY